VVGKALATFRKSTSAWSTVASSSIPLPSSAVAGPSTVKTEPTDPDDPAPPPVQLTKRKGGLRTAVDLQAELDAARSRSPELEAPDPGKTVHRDASGRKLDIEKMRAEEKAKEEEEKRKEKEREEWSKGITQRQDREERAQLEKHMATQDVAR
jgi:pre-mRNA-splicing factor CWC26